MSDWINDLEEDVRGEQIQIAEILHLLALVSQKLLSTQSDYTLAPAMSRSTVERLYSYKNFRHRFISGYGFQLKIEKMTDLVENVSPLWDKIQEELEGFFKNIRIG